MARQLVVDIGQSISSDQIVHSWRGSRKRIQEVERIRNAAIVHKILRSNTSRFILRGFPNVIKDLEKVVFSSASSINPPYTSQPQCINPATLQLWGWRHLPSRDNKLNKKGDTYDIPKQVSSLSVIMCMPRFTPNIWSCFQQSSEINSGAITAVSRLELEHRDLWSGGSR